jgi:hypothetical protein
MATLLLATVNDGSTKFRFETELEGTLYRFLFIWNERDEAWFMTVSDTDDDPIASGVRVVADFPLLRRVADARAPLGDIVALDSTGEGDPGLADLGVRVSLVYEESE